MQAMRCSMSQEAVGHVENHEDVTQTTRWRLACAQPEIRSRQIECGELRASDRPL